jgi:hypothetical protein
MLNPLCLMMQMCRDIPAYFQIRDELNGAWEVIDNGDTDSCDERVLLAA